MTCPRCGRPLALARPSCLYCGAPLPPELVAQAEAASGPAAVAAEIPAVVAAERGEPAPPPLAHVILDLAQADAELLAEALAISRYEAAQRVRRGGLQLHRALPPDQAEVEAARLAGAGLAVLVAAGEAVKAAAEPELLVGGRLEPGLLRARGEGAARELRAADLLLVVRGPIRREYQAQPRLRRLMTATLAEGYRFHLHRRSAARPLEIDPENFEFDGWEGAAASSLLRVAGWLEAMTAAAVVDDGFRFLSPALGAAEEAGDGRLDARRLLGKRLAESGRDEGTRQILDNVRQFRAYSAWRGAAERLRASC